MRIRILLASATMLLVAGCSSGVVGQAAAAAPTARTPAAADIPEPAPPQVIARDQAPCPELNDLTTDADTGEWIVCLSGGRAVPLWSPVGQVPEGAFNYGDACATGGRLAQTADGKALMCLHGKWGYGP